MTNPLDSISDELDRAADSEYIQETVDRIKPHLPSRARNVIYWTGIALGALVAGGGIVQTALSGDAEALVGSVIGLAWSLSNLLAKLNLTED